MNSEPISIIKPLFFKIRFNTTHGETNLYWRVIIEDTEYLVSALKCYVNTHSDASFDIKAGTLKWHIAGTCSEFHVDASQTATFK